MLECVGTSTQQRPRGAGDGGDDPELQEPHRTTGQAWTAPSLRGQTWSWRSPTDHRSGVWRSSFRPYPSATDRGRCIWQLVVQLCCEDFEWFFREIGVGQSDVTVASGRVETAPCPLHIGAGYEGCRTARTNRMGDAFFFVRIMCGRVHLKML